MTPTLRRSHRIIWLTLAVALPIGVVAALRLPRVSIPLKSGASGLVHQRFTPSSRP